MDSDNDSYHSENEFYYPDEENVLQENKNKLKMAAVKIQHKNCKNVICRPRMLRIGKNCALGTAVLKTFAPFFSVRIGSL